MFEWLNERLSEIGRHIEQLEGPEEGF